MHVWIRCYLLLWYWVSSDNTTCPTLDIGPSTYGNKQCKTLGNRRTCNVTCDPGAVLPSYKSTEQAICEDSTWTHEPAYYACYKTWKQVGTLNPSANGRVTYQRTHIQTLMPNDCYRTYTDAMRIKVQENSTRSYCRGEYELTLGFLDRRELDDHFYITFDIIIFFYDRDVWGLFNCADDFYYETDVFDPHVSPLEIDKDVMLKCGYPWRLIPGHRKQQMYVDDSTRDDKNPAIKGRMVYKTNNTFINTIHEECFTKFYRLLQLAVNAKRGICRHYSYHAVRLQRRGMFDKFSFTFNMWMVKRNKTIKTGMSIEDCLHRIERRVYDIFDANITYDVNLGRKCNYPWKIIKVRRLDYFQINSSPCGAKHKQILLHGEKRCVLCLPGNYYYGSHCKICPPGTFNSEEAADSCLPCPFIDSDLEVQSTVGIVSFDGCPKERKSIEPQARGQIPGKADDSSSPSVLLLLTGVVGVIYHVY